MVIRELDKGGGWFCIPQSQHAAISGQLARGWGNEEFPAPEPHAEMCLAAERHDDGMDEFDSEPDLDPETGLPRSFMAMPLERWLECWRRGPALVAEDDPYAGLMVSLHGAHLLGYRRLEEEDEAGRADVEAFRAEQAELAEELVSECSSDHSLEQYLDGRTIEHNRRLIALWDALSLAVCMPRLPDSFDGVRGLEGEVTISLEEVGIPGKGELLVAVDPWPFELEQVALVAAGRVLTSTYSDRAQMQAALVAAEVRQLAVTLQRA